MMIQHSLTLLQELHRLETELARLESLAHLYGLEIDTEECLKFAYQRYIKAKSSLKPLTETDNVS